MTAQSPAARPAGGPAPGDRFHSRVDMVALDVCVTTRSGGAVETLGPQDFLVLEDGRPQRITLMVPGDRASLGVVLLLDRSGSMEGKKLEQARAAAGAFAGVLREDDQLAVLVFNSRVSRLLPLGADHAAVTPALAGLSAYGQTGLYEAVLVALRDLARAGLDRPSELRRAIVLLSDGEDTNSIVAFDDVLEEVRRAGVLIYVVSLPAGNGRGGTRHSLLSLAYESGGRVLSVPESEHLPSAFTEIAGELRHLYRIGYVPDPPKWDGHWHGISVRTTRSDLRVRARTGYYAPRLTPASVR